MIGTVVRRTLVLALIWALTPGFAEASVDLVHQLRAGHTAHTAAPADDHEQDEEHGCTGAFHLCGCHSSQAFQPNAFKHLKQTPATTATWGSLSSLHPDPHQATVFRPPKS